MRAPRRRRGGWKLKATMKRREFVARCAAATGLTGIALGARDAMAAAPVLSKSVPQYYDMAKLARVGVSSWSFRNDFASTRTQDFEKPGPLISLLDFPQIVADRYQIHRLEFAAAHFAGRDSAYLVQLRRQMERAHCRLVNIGLSAGSNSSSGESGDLSSRDASARLAAVAAVKDWMTTARVLGALSVSVSPGALNPADLSPALASFRELAAYGRVRRVDVLIENQTGLDPGTIIDLIRETGGRGIGALPDFALFPDAAARDAGLEILFPRATVLCHAGGAAFDAEGNETTFDFRECIDMAKRFRFRGTYSVEYEGTGDPYQGVQNVVNELIRFL